MPTGTKSFPNDVEKLLEIGNAAAVTGSSKPHMHNDQRLLPIKVETHTIIAVFSGIRPVYKTANLSGRNATAWR